MGLHSSAGRALQRKRRSHGFESRESPQKPFFRATSQLLKLRLNCHGHIFISVFKMLIKIAVDSKTLIKISIVVSNRERRATWET